MATAIVASQVMAKGNDGTRKTGFIILRSASSLRYEPRIADCTKKGRLRMILQVIPVLRTYHWFKAMLTRAEVVTIPG